MPRHPAPGGGWYPNQVGAVPALTSKLRAEERCLGFVCQLMLLSNICLRGVCLSPAHLGDDRTVSARLTLQKHRPPGPVPGR